MGSQTCLDFLNTYADYLTNNPDVDVPLPVPVAFSGPNCTGLHYPDFTDMDSPPLLFEPSTMDFPEVQSMFVPESWEVKPASSSEQPAFTAQFNMILPSIHPPYKSVHLHQPPKKFPQFSSHFTFIQEWKYLMCTNQTTSILGSHYLRSYQPSSSECDNFMDTFCQSQCAVATNGDCSKNSGECHEQCVCLLNEKEIKCSFDPVPSDKKDDLQSLTQFIPVTCLGKQCSGGGYRWGRMRNRPCNIRLCQQIVDIVGEHISVEDKQEFWCGNRPASQSFISLQPPPVSETPSEAGEEKGVAMPTWAWIMIAVGALLLFLALPMALIAWTRHPLEVQTGGSGGTAAAGPQPPTDPSSTQPQQVQQQA